MRFSIRALLAFGFVVALAMLDARTLDQAARDRGRIVELNGEIRSLEATVRLDDPLLHRTMLHAADGHEHLRILRERAVDHFDQLQEKYSTIESAGPDVVAIRGVPMLQDETGHAPTVYRIVVPAGRSVWLKFGVHIVDGKSQSQRTPDDGDGLLTTSPFDDSGPFEFQIPPGDQKLSIEIGPVQPDSNRIGLVIAIDDHELLRSAYVSEDLPGPNSTSISGRLQLDFPPDRKLPWLITARMKPRWPKTEKLSLNHGFTIWLSDHASGFGSFPNE